MSNVPPEHGARIGKALKAISRSGTLRGVHGFTTNWKEVETWLMHKGLVRFTGGRLKVAIGEKGVQTYIQSKATINAVDETEPAQEEDEPDPAPAQQESEDETAREGEVESPDQDKYYSGDLIALAAETAKEVRNGTVSYKQGMTVAALLKDIVDMKKVELQQAVLKSKGIHAQEVPLYPRIPANLGDHGEA